MAVRVKQWSTNGVEKPEVLDNTQTQREATVDGYTFHFAPNQVRNFLDEGVGAAVAAFGATGVVEDTIAFGSSRF